MQIHRYKVLQLYERTKDYLLQHEAVHSVMFRAINALINRPERFSEQSVPINGNLRQATAAERELLIAWCRALIAEALPDEEQNEENTIDRLLHRGSLYVWHDQLPVSMANYTEPTPNGIGINLVYTPPEFRRHGYASACVAALSQYLLDRGYRYCFLFTDLANPTSNKIYQTLGYQAVGDLSNYWFDL